MWWSSSGERVLNGTERELIREGLSSLWDDVEAAEDEDGAGTTEFVVFDELPKAERLALLAGAAKGWTDENEPCPDLTALMEGTVARSSPIFATTSMWKSSSTRRQSPGVLQQDSITPTSGDGARYGSSGRD